MLVDVLLAVSWLMIVGGVCLLSLPAGLITGGVLLAAFACVYVWRVLVEGAFYSGWPEEADTEVTRPRM